jgi:hypothetical protein
MLTFSEVICCGMFGSEVGKILYANVHALNARSRGKKKVVEVAVRGE